MSSINIFIDTTVKPNKHDEYPIKLQAIHDRYVSRVTLFNLEEKYWDKKKGRVVSTYNRSVDLNRRIIALVLKAEAVMLNLRPKQKFNIKNLLFEESTAAQNNTLIYYLSDLAEAKKGSVSDSFCNRIKLVIRRVEEISPETMPSEIDDRWLDNFRNKCNVVGSTFANYVKIIRRAIKLAKKDHQVVDESVLEYRVKITKTIKHKLSEEQIRLLKDLNLVEGSRLEMVRDFFMLQIYFSGIRVRDLLVKKHINIIDGRLYNTQKKTDNNQSIKVTNEAMNIINKYGNSGYLIPFIDESHKGEELEKQIHSKKALINKDLKVLAALIGFNHPLTTHIARHSFAILALNKNIPIKVISTMLGHKSLKTTMGYLSELMEDKVIDEAAEEVFSLFRD